MPLVIVEAVAPVSSWRPAEAQTFHPTLPLPPYTSQVGMLGAALGLNLSNAFDFISTNDIKLGVGGWHRGRMRDLWKYQKLELVDKRNASYSDIVLREHWVDSRIALLVESPNATHADQICRAYQRPQFPLTAGVSDALIHVRRVSIVDAKPKPTRDLTHTLVYRDIAADYRVDSSVLQSLPMMQSLTAPSIERIPTGFTFDARCGRKLAGRAVVTFVGDRITLSDSDNPILAYEVTPISSAFISEMKSWPSSNWSIPVHRYDLKTSTSAS